MSPTLPWEETKSIVAGGAPSLFDALTWKRRLTGFTGRDAERDATLAWARGGGDAEAGFEISARLIAGPGGSGKTRLAAEAIERLRAEGWTAGFLETGARSGRAIDGSGRAGLLLVIDYPEERPEEVTDDLFAGLVDHDRAPIPIRILLLSRRGFDAWSKYAEDLGHRFGRQELAVPGPLDPEAAERVVRDAAEGLAALTGGAPPPLDGAAAWLAHAPLHRLPLFAAAAGLHAATAPGAAFELGGAALMKDLAKRERNRARKISERAGLGQKTLERLLALATLSAEGLDQGTIAALHGLEIAPEVSAQILEDRVKATPWWRRAAAGVPGRLARLEPDRPAAAFAALALELGGDPPSPLADWLGPPAEASGAEFGPVLSRLAYDMSMLPGPESAALEAAALAMLRARPERAALFTELSFREATSFSAGFAAEVTKLLLDAEEAPERRAMLLSNLGGYLSSHGRREEALAAAEEAVETYRPLAAARPDAFAPALAISLSSLGIRLSALGRREEALAAEEEAVAIRRPLATARPDAFAPELAASLSNLGIRLSELGRREEALAAAEEAVETYRPLAAARPDAFAPELARSVSNLGFRLSDLGRREEALAATKEAVETYRPLAAARPDAFAPELATALSNLGVDLATLGRREEALAATKEAVAIRRPLAAARPDAFAPDLAGSLSNLGSRLSDLGRREEALAAVEEAVATCRPLAAARPDAFAPDLASVLSNLGNRLSALGRREEALAATKEAVAIRRPLAAARPDAFA
ncbi:MAG: tetratricopeptide repeat protein, partial [Pseudomonadota bacterium]